MRTNDSGAGLSEAPEAPKARPEADGSLSVEAPSALSRFDMGNATLFATFDGSGCLRRGLLAEGHELGSWKLELRIGGETAAFSRGRAIGRLWELELEREGTRAELDSFLGEAEPAIYQRLELANHSSSVARLGLRLEYEPGAGGTLGDSLCDARARLRAMLPGTATWWATAGAKLIRPYAARRVRLDPEGIVEAQGKRKAIWRSFPAPERIERRGRHAFIDFTIELGPWEKREIAWSLSAGDTPPSGPEKARQALASARAYGAWLADLCSEKDSLLKSMFVAGLNAAISMFKTFPEDFEGLVAGPDYAYPPRLYFRDGYWTAQVLIRFRPDLARRHILSIARGVHEDGQCPSGVFAPHVLREHASGRVDSLDWLPDHFDSPALFVLLVSDYVEATGDAALLDERITLWRGKDREGRAVGLMSLVEAAADYLAGKDRDGLIEKPHEANDWADNVRRSSYVAYDQALYAAALLAVARLTEARGKAEAACTYSRRAERARAALDRELWDEKRGYFVNYRRAGFVEGNCSLDTLVALRYGLVDEDKVERLLGAASRLITSENPDQPFGDWGVMCAYPNYGLSSDLFSKSAAPYRYHNGADWPYLDGLYAEVLLGRGRPEWRYVLSRWWEYGLSRGWLTPVEYYSPPYAPGGMLQGWSSMPAAALAKSWK